MTLSSFRPADIPTICRNCRQRASCLPTTSRSGRQTVAPRQWKLGSQTQPSAGTKKFGMVKKNKYGYGTDDSLFQPLQINFDSVYWSVEGRVQQKPGQSKFPGILLIWSCIKIKQMDPDDRNEYFQDYSLFSNGQIHTFNIQGLEYSENDLLPEFREPLSLELSQPDHPEVQQQDNVFQSTKAAINTADTVIREGGWPGTLPNTQIQFEEIVLSRYRSTLQGSKDDTVELNTNFKTLLVNFFKELVLANELEVHEIEHVHKFAQRVPSFNSLKQLLRRAPENRHIRGLVLGLFSSSECIRKVMGSRSRIKTKLQMVKYIQKIRVNILSTGAVVKWKDFIKKEDT